MGTEGTEVAVAECATSYTQRWSTTVARRVLMLGFRRYDRIVGQDCEVGEWTAWAACSKVPVSGVWSSPDLAQECGGGEQRRKREVTQAPGPGGQECQTLEQRRKCNLHVCDPAAEVGTRHATQLSRLQLMESPECDGQDCRQGKVS